MDFGGIDESSRHKQALAKCCAELILDDERDATNQTPTAVRLHSAGHPRGRHGARLVTTNHAQGASTSSCDNGRYALCNLCIGGGQGNLLSFSNASRRPHRGSVQLDFSI